MKHVTVRIQGTTPLLCNRFTEEAQMKASEQTGASIVGDKGSPHEQAEKKLYRDNGHLVIPSPNILKSITEGGTFFKAGRSKVTTQKKSLIPAAVMIVAAAIPIESKEGWEVDTRPVRIPATGGRILAHRPMFNDWVLEFEMEVDTDIMSTKLMREIVDAAGKRIGLGDFRPECKGPFGRYIVTKWEEKDN